MTSLLRYSAAAVAALLADVSPPPASPADDRAKFERDRQSILAMAGEFKVNFDMRETVPFVSDYAPLPAKSSDGHEVVRVVKDSGTHIILQHLLVVEPPGAPPMVIKHWRQDWTYQPAEVLVYTGSGHWKVQPVSPEARRGAWSQTVWQTDDSPRYGAVGRWAYEDGVSRWFSSETWRPLARRDALRHPPYDHYIGTNRHALTPSGWVQEQDNTKIGPRNGVTTTYVHEVVINTYARDPAFAVSAADKYWTATADYWTAVRAAWDAAIQRGRGVAVEEEAENGSATGAKLMGLADDLAEGKTTPPAAIVEARKVIDSLPPASP